MLGALRPPGAAEGTKPVRVAGFAVGQCAHAPGQAHDSSSGRRESRRRRRFDTLLSRRRRRRHILKWRVIKAHQFLCALWSIQHTPQGAIAKHHGEAVKPPSCFTRDLRTGRASTRRPKCSLQPAAFYASASCSPRACTRVCVVCGLSPPGAASSTPKVCEQPGCTWTKSALSGRQVQRFDPATLR